MEHSKTPWRIEPATKKDNWRIIAANNQVVSTFSGNMDMDNARRIVAAVNACAGLHTEYLENVGLPEFVGKTLCADIAQQELDAVTAIRDELLDERDQLREVCAEAYQFAGAYDAPVEVLDNLSAAANGWPLPHESFLPVMDSEAVSQRDELLAVLEGLLDEVAGCMCTYEMPARAVIQKVRGGE